MFQKYIKKQIPVDAILITEDNINFILRELEEASVPFKYNPENKTLKIKTLEGWYEGKVNQHYLVKEALGRDYLVKGIEGEYYFVRKDIFEKTYEPLTKPNENDKINEDLFSLLNRISKIFNVKFRNPDRFSNDYIEKQIKIGELLLLKHKKYFSDDIINLYKVVGFDEKNNLLFVIRYNSVFDKYFDIIDPREYIYISSNPDIDLNLLEQEFRHKHTNNYTIDNNIIKKLKYF